MRTKSIWLVAIINLCFHYSWAAFDMAPIISSVSPAGPGATTSFTLTNGSDTKTPVQIGIYRREPDVDGKEKYEESKDSGEMFQIFPSQIILNPKEKRTVRVTYVGDAKVKEELAFRIIAEEFPINVSDPKKVTNKAVASIAVMTKYVGSLYVTPLNAQADVKVEASMLKSGANAQMVLVMQNKGTEHYITKQSKLMITATADGKVYPMPEESMAVIGTQNILAGRTRKFTIPWPKGIPQGPVKVNLELAKK